MISYMQARCQQRVQGRQTPAQAGERASTAQPGVVKDMKARIFPSYNSGK